VRVDLYEHMLAMKAGRRRFIQGAAALAGATALSSSFVGRVFAAEMSADEKALRAQILQIPGVGKVSAGLDWGAYVLILLTIAQTVFAYLRTKDAGDAMP